MAGQVIVGSAAAGNWFQPSDCSLYLKIKCHFGIECLFFLTRFSEPAFCNVNSRLFIKFSQDSQIVRHKLVWTPPDSVNDVSEASSVSPGESTGVLGHVTAIHKNADGGILYSQSDNVAVSQGEQGIARLLSGSQNSTDGLAANEAFNKVGLFNQLLGAPPVTTTLPMLTQMILQEHQQQRKLQKMIKQRLVIAQIKRLEIQWQEKPTSDAHSHLINQHLYMVHSLPITDHQTHCLQHKTLRQLPLEFN